MKLMNRKTRKAIRKTVNKVIRKQGSKIAAGLAGGLASTLATLASTESPHGKGKKSNLAELSERISDAVAGKGRKKLRKQKASKGKARRTSKPGRRAQELEEPEARV